MAIAGVAFNGIVPELLTNDNYERWSVLMKNYLMGQDLWDVVLSNPKRDNKEWKKDNAQALHAIQLSCRPYAFREVQRCETAKIAWNQLSLLFSTYEILEDIEKGLYVEDDIRKIIDDLNDAGGGENTRRALQMRRELQLFKKVEKMADPTCKEAKNVYGMKPRDVYDKTHEELVKAVFTVPGGYNQETGMPILLNRNWFKDLKGRVCHDLVFSMYHQR
ncbi:hypothetical protein L6164_028837 [Bauhinia variegata]|uniref:Uncharacterized protein n=1 Tax=Bauhinia variegata TaxID=167791 RepID=A0ACB9L7W9_BAUVA|nr:hypothetical protein L6164_028837 [Bauhinia variegata]